MEPFILLPSLATVSAKRRTLKGQGLATLGPHLAAMALLGGTLYAAGLLRFRRLR